MDAQYKSLHYRAACVTVYSVIGIKTNNGISTTGK